MRSGSLAGIVSVMKDSCAGENRLYYLVCEKQRLVFSKDAVMFYCMSILFVAFSCSGQFEDCQKCDISGSHSGGTEDSGLLGCYAVPIG